MHPIPTDLRLVELFKSNLNKDKTINFIAGLNDESELSFQELYDRSFIWLGRLQRKGMSPGDKLVIVLKDNQLLVELFWACMLGGIVPVPVMQGHSQEHINKLHNILVVLDGEKFITDQEFFEKIKDHFDTKLSSDEKNKLLSNGYVPEDLVDNSIDNEAPGKEHVGDLDDLAFIQFSSGSTRNAKGIQLTHRNLIINISDMADRVNYKEDWVALSWMPLTHDLGIIGFHMLPIVRGISHHIMDTTLFARRPLSWLQKVSEKRANFICSPNFGFKHVLNALKDSQSYDYDLSCIEGVICGAEPISYKLVVDFTNRLKEYGFSDRCIRPCYGLAECVLAVCIVKENQLVKTVSLARDNLKVGDNIVESTDPDKSVIFTLLGEKLEKLDVRFIDSSGKSLGENIIGELEIKGDNVTKGYIGSTTDDSEVISKDGWLNTGDLGFFHKGEIVVTGRKKDVIIIDGQNLYSHDLENIVEKSNICSLGEVAVTAHRSGDDVGDKILVFMRKRGDLRNFVEKIQSVKQTLFQSIGVEVFDVVPVKQIPKTTSGKFKRYTLAEEYGQGVYQEDLDTVKKLLAELNSVSATRIGSDEISEKILGMLHDLLENDSLQPSDGLFDIGASSVQLVALGERINTEYPDSIDVTDFYDCETVQSLIDIVKSRIKEADTVVA